MEMVSTAYNPMRSIIRSPLMCGYEKQHSPTDRHGGSIQKSDAKLMFDDDGPPISYRSGLEIDDSLSVTH